MPRADSLRSVIRAQNLGDALRRSEFQAIVEALRPDESVGALAPAELRGRGGYVVATERRVFFAYAGVAGTAVSPVGSIADPAEFEEGDEGTCTLVLRGGTPEEVRLERIPRPHAEAFSRFLGDSSRPKGLPS